jgi:hypothetical protein
LCLCSGNPASSLAVDAELQEDKPSRVYLASYKYGQNETRFSLRQQFCGVSHALIFTLQDNDFWDTKFSYHDSGPSHKSAISIADEIDNGNETYDNCDQETSWNNWNYSQLYGGTLASITTTCNVTNVNTGFDNFDKPLASRFCDEKVITDSDGDIYDGSDCNSHITTHDKLSQQEQFKANFYTGGKSVAGAMKVFGLSGIAHKLEFFPVDPGARLLSPGEFTIGGFGSLDSDGIHYVTLAADTTVDVTPKAAFHYYDGGANATEVKLGIFDATTGNELTDQTTSVVVGQQINLYCVVSAPTPEQPTGYQWNVPGIAISNFVITSSSATVYSNFPTTLSNVVFYWVDGATNRALTCSATVRGQKVTGQALFNIYRPSVTFTDQPPAFATNSAGFLALGDGSGEMNYTVGVSSAFVGKTDYSQLINRIAANGRTSETTGNQFWLDSFPFYLSKAGGSVYAVQTNRAKLLLFNDSPGYELSHPFSNTTSVFDRFKDYIMFRPDNGTPSNNIYVPLGKIVWSWSASTTYSGGAWPPPTAAISRPTAPDGGYEFPQWSQVYVNPK